MPAARITLAHFSVSSAMSFPKSAGEPGSTVPPKSARRAFISGSVSAALISLFSLSTISAGGFFGAPRNTPAGVIEILNKEVNAGLLDPAMKARFADLANVPLPGSPAEFGKLIADETEKWGKVIRFAGIKVQ